MATTTCTEFATQNAIQRDEIVQKTDEVLRGAIALRQGVIGWQNAAVELNLGVVIESVIELLSWTQNKRSLHSICAPMTKDQALSQSRQIETRLSELRLMLNQTKDTWSQQGLEYTALFRVRLRALKVSINEAPLHPLNWAESVDHTERNQTNRQKRKERRREERTLDGSVQMEALESMGVSMLGGIGGDLVGPLLHQGTAFIGTLLQDALGLPPNRDSPSQISVDPNDWCLADVPRPIASLAYKKVHTAPNARSVVQQNTGKSMDLKQRFQEKSLIASFDASIACNTVSELLGDVSVSPQIFATVSGNTTTGPFSREETPLSYFAEFFTFWRGDIDIHVNVVQCAFQKGQIGVFFNPNNDILATSDFPGRTSNLLGHVFDISESNDQVLTIPFVNDKDYKRLVRAYGQGTAMTGGTLPWNSVPMESSLGKVWIYIVNPIVGPATAPQTVHVNVWISSKNMTYHVPREPDFFIQLNGTTQSETTISSNVEMEIITEEVAPPGQNVDETTAENPIEEVAQIATADTENIAGRNYIIRTNIQWDTSSVRGSVLLTADVPSELLFNENMAPSGLFNFHEFYRGGMLVTLKLASQCQYLGLAMLIVHPSAFDRPIAECVSSLTQLPHALVDIGRNTTAVVTVPWLHVKRLLRTSDLNHNVAVVKLIVLNQMRIPAGACATINATLTVALTAPYFGVKKAKAQTLVGRVQSKESGPSDPTPGQTTGASAPEKKNTSDMAAKKVRATKPWKVRNPPTKSYIADHTSVYDLLKRPTFGNTGLVLIGTTTTPTVLCDISPQLAPVHGKIITTWAFYNGGLRVHLTSTSVVGNGTLVFVQPKFDGVQRLNSLVTLTGAPLSVFDGVQIWKSSLIPSATFGLPYYAATPLLFTPQMLAPLNNADMYAIGAVRLFVQSTSSNGVMRYATSVGDDFELHFPLPMPKTTFSAPFLAGLNSGWQRDLTQDGDVESNPGPVAMWIRKKLNNIIDDVLADQTEKAKEKLKEAKVFLARHLFANVVEDIIVPVLSAFMDIALHLRLIVIETNKTVLMAAFTAIALRVYPFVKDGFATVEYIRSTFEQCLKKKIGGEDFAKFRQSTESMWSTKTDRESAVDAEEYDHFVGQVEMGKKDHSMMGLLTGCNMGKLAAAVCVSSLIAAVGMFGQWVSHTVVDSAKAAAEGRFLKTCTTLGKVGQGVAGFKHIWGAIKDGLATAMDYFIEPEPAEVWWAAKQTLVRRLLGRFRANTADGSYAANVAFIKVLGTSPYDDLVVNRDLIDDMIRYFPQLPTDIVPLDLRVDLRQLIAVKARLSSQERASAPRNEPVGVWLTGTAGCGKSVFGKEVLPALLARKMNLPGEWHSHLYQVPRSEDQKYWDGYTGQYITAIDDYGQNTDDKDFIETISLISSANCPLAMAAIDDKNMTFTSRVVFASTNLKNCRGLQTVKDKSAIVRRFPIAVHMKTRGGGILDYGKLTRDMTAAVDTGSDPVLVYDQAIELEEWDIDVGKATGKTWSLDGLIDEIAKQIQQREHAHPIGDILGSQYRGRDVKGRVQMECELDGSGSGDDDNVPHWSQNYQRGKKKRSRPAPYVVPRLNKGYKLLDGESYDINLDDDGPPQPPEKKFQGLKSIFLMLGIAVGTGLVLYLLVTILKTWVFGMGEEEGDEQTKYAETAKKAAGPRKMVGTTQVLDKENKIAANVLRVSTDKFSSWAIAVDNRHMIVNKHFLLQAGGVFRVQLRRRDGTDGSIVAVNYQNCCYDFGDNIDVMLIRLTGVNLDHVRSIKHLLMKKAAWQALPENFQAHDWQGRELPVGKIPFRLNDPTWKDHPAWQVYPGKMNYVTQQGDCGQPYFASTVTQNPFFGIHSGHVESRSYACITPIIYEDIVSAMEQLATKLGSTTVIADYRLQGWEKTGEEVTEFDLGHLELLGQGTLNGEKLNAGSVPTTDFIRSPLQNDEWDDSYCPSIKRTVVVEGVRIDPLFSGAQKYELNPNTIDTLAISVCAAEYCKEVPHGVGRILTDVEMMNGYGEMGKLVTKTSAGIITKYIKKEDLFDKQPGAVVDGVTAPDTLVWSEKASTFIIPLYGKTFRAHFDEACGLCSVGIKPDVIWVSTLKDELRPKEKAKKGKTRVFENPDVTYTLLVRKYFGHFIQWFKANRGFKLHHAIGIDREVAAPEIYEGLKWKDRVFDVDYKNFDGSVHPVLFEFFTKVTDWYYGPKNRSERHVIIDILRSSLHLVGDTLFQSSQGNKSGNAMTDVFNSVCNAGLVYMSVYVAYRDVSMVRAELPFITYGDDLIASVSPDLEEFNRVWFAQFAKALGLVVTSADKGAELTPFTEMKDATFLKSSFVEGMPFRFPLPVEVIHRELRWERKQNKGDNVVLKQRIVQALDMMSHHSEESYNTLVRQLTASGFGDWCEGSYAWRLERLRVKQIASSLTDSPFDYARHEPVDLEELVGESQFDCRLRGQPPRLDTLAFMACERRLRPNQPDSWSCSRLDPDPSMFGPLSLEIAGPSGPFFRVPPVRSFALLNVAVTGVPARRGVIQVFARGTWRIIPGEIINVTRPYASVTGWDDVLFRPLSMERWAAETPNFNYAANLESVAYCPQLATAYVGCDVFAELQLNRGYMRELRDGYLDDEMFRKITQRTIVHFGGPTVVLTAARPRGPIGPFHRIYATLLVRKVEDVAMSFDIVTMIRDRAGEYFRTLCVEEGTPV